MRSMSSSLGNSCDHVSGQGIASWLAFLGAGGLGDGCCTCQWDVLSIGRDCHASITTNTEFQRSCHARSRLSCEFHWKLGLGTPESFASSSCLFSYVIELDFHCNSLKFNIFRQHIYVKEHQLHHFNIGIYTLFQPLISKCPSTKGRCFVCANGPQLCWARGEGFQVHGPRANRLKEMYGPCWKKRMTYWLDNYMYFPHNIWRHQKRLCGHVTIMAKRAKRCWAKHVQ